MSARGLGNGGTRKKILLFLSRRSRRFSNGAGRGARSFQEVSLRRIGLLLLLGATAAVLFPTQALGASLLVILLLSFLFAFASANIRKFSPDDKDLFLLAILLVVLMTTTKASRMFFPLIGQVLQESQAIA